MDARSPGPGGNPRPRTQLAGYPTKALTNPVFYLKLGLVGAALWVLRILLQQASDGRATRLQPTRVRFLAVASLACWDGAIAAGSASGLYTHAAPGKLGSRARQGGCRSCLARSRCGISGFSRLVKGVPVTAFHRFVPFAVAGFVVNAASGLLFLPRIAGGVSLFLWTAVIVCGRLLTFYRPFPCEDDEARAFLVRCLL